MDMTGLHQVALALKLEKAKTEIILTMGTAIGDQHGEHLHAF